MFKKFIIFLSMVLLGVSLDPGLSRKKILFKRGVMGLKRSLKIKNRKRKIHIKKRLFKKIHKRKKLLKKISNNKIKKNTKNKKIIYQKKGRVYINRQSLKEKNTIEQNSFIKKNEEFFNAVQQNNGQKDEKNNFQGHQANEEKYAEIYKNEGFYAAIYKNERLDIVSRKINKTRMKNTPLAIQERNSLKKEKIYLKDKNFNDNTSPLFLSNLEIKDIEEKTAALFRGYKNTPGLKNLTNLDKAKELRNYLKHSLLLNTITVFETLTSQNKRHWQRLFDAAKNTINILYFPYVEYTVLNSEKITHMENFFFSEDKREIYNIIRNVPRRASFENQSSVTKLLTKIQEKIHQILLLADIEWGFEGENSEKNHRNLRNSLKLILDTRLDYEDPQRKTLDHIIAYGLHLGSNLNADPITFQGGMENFGRDTAFPLEGHQ